MSVRLDGAGRLVSQLAIAAEAEGLNANELTVLSPSTDPYRFDTPAGHRLGAWFGGHVAQFLPPYATIHLRGLHYVLASAGEVVSPAGKAYTNTDRKWVLLCYAAKAAHPPRSRYLARAARTSGDGDRPTLPSAVFDAGRLHQGNPAKAAVQHAGRLRHCDKAAQIAQGVGLSAGMTKVEGEISTALAHGPNPEDDRDAAGQNGGPASTRSNDGGSSRSDEQPGWLQIGSDTVIADRLAADLQWRFSKIVFCEGFWFYQRGTGTLLGRRRLSAREKSP